MFHKRKVFTGFTIITLLTIAGIFLSSLSRKAIPDITSTPSQNMEEIKIITRAGNKTDWIILSNNADINGNEAKLKNVRFTSPSKNIIMKSPECIYNINTGETIFDDRLLILVGNDLRAELKNAYIKNDLLESNSPVKIEKGNAIITGQRIKAEGEVINISGNVKMVIR